MKKYGILLLTVLSVTALATIAVALFSFGIFGEEKNPTLWVTTDDIEVGQKRVAVLKINITDNPGISCIRFKIEADERLSYYGKLFGDVFEEGTMKDYVVVNSRYGENVTKDGEILSVHYTYPDDAVAGTLYEVKLTDVTCINSDIEEVELNVENGGVRISDTVYTAATNTPDFKYEGESEKYAATTARMLPEGKTVIIDGEADTAWTYAEEEKIENPVDKKGKDTGSETTGAFRTLWEEIDGKYYVDVFATIDVGNREISTYDAVRIYFVLNDNMEVSDIIRDYTNFGTGIYGVTAYGEINTKSGWHNKYGGNVYTRFQSAAKITGKSTYQVEMRFELTPSEGRYPNGITAGHTLILGVAHCDEGSVRIGSGWTNIGYYPESLGKLILGSEMEEYAYVAGDANGDEKVNGKDAIALLKYLADWDIKLYTESADVNCDGKIAGKDSILLLKYLASWDVKLGK